MTQDANEVEVKFGLKLTGGADLVFATAGGEGTISLLDRVLLHPH